MEQLGFQPEDGGAGIGAYDVAPAAQVPAESQVFFPIYRQAGGRPEEPAESLPPLARQVGGDIDPTSNGPALEDLSRPQALRLWLVRLVPFMNRWADAAPAACCGMCAPCITATITGLTAEAVGSRKPES